MHPLKHVVLLLSICFMEMENVTSFLWCSLLLLKKPTFSMGGDGDQLYGGPPSLTFSPFFMKKKIVWAHHSPDN